MKTILLTILMGVYLLASAQSVYNYHNSEESCRRNHPDCQGICHARQDEIKGSKNRVRVWRRPGVRLKPDPKITKHQKQAPYLIKLERTDDPMIYRLLVVEKNEIQYASGSRDGGHVLFISDTRRKVHPSIRMEVLSRKGAPVLAIPHLYSNSDGLIYFGQIAPGRYCLRFYANEELLPVACYKVRIF